MEAYFGSFADFTYDLKSEEIEIVPTISPVPQSIIDLPTIIFSKQQQSISNKTGTECHLSTLQDSNQISFDDDEDNHSESSSSADFEIDTIRKDKKRNKTQNVNLNTIVYGFPKPVSEVHRPFVTHKAPLTKRGKNSLQQDSIRLKNRLSSRRNLHLMSTTTKQHEFILSDIKDL